jgi:hypothetical protein
METSYDSKGKFFALASYYLSVVNYSGVNKDNQTSVAYNAVGGTGRIGAGTWFGKAADWGALAMVDASGFTIGAQTFTYLSGAALAVYRYRLGGAGQLRVNFGPTYREIPETIGDASGVGYQQSKIVTLGPLLGANFYRGLTSKIGFQLNLQVTHSTMGLSTPGGGANIGKLSYQYGVLGSMTLMPQLVGFVGYAYRLDNVGYQSNTTLGNGEPNEISITGQYINFMLEYGF